MRMMYHGPIFEPIEVEVLEVDFIKNMAVVEYEIEPNALARVFRNMEDPPLCRVRRSVPNTMLKPLEQPSR